jgi:hypothetical protein
MPEGKEWRPKEPMKVFFNVYLMFGFKKMKREYRKEKYKMAGIY